MNGMRLSDFLRGHHSYQRNSNSKAVSSLSYENIGLLAKVSVTSEYQVLRGFIPRSFMGFASNVNQMRGG